MVKKNNYQKILNPKTNRYVKVNGIIGRWIIKKYFSMFKKMINRSGKNDNSTYRNNSNTFPTTTTNYNIQHPTTSSSS